jgi:aminoglycoside 3-N-acetyltransferase
VSLSHQTSTATIRQLADYAFVLAELWARQIYFRSSSLQRLRAFAFPRRPSRPQRADIDQLRNALVTAGATTGALVMAHTSVGGVMLQTPGEVGIGKRGPVATASAILRELISAVGHEGTLVLPTHPHYRDDPGYHSRIDKSRLVLNYDPELTPSSVGLVSELFRKFPGSLRSRHPLQTLSCWGRRAEELLSGNLNDDKPLPHGVYSGYYRFCVARGLVLSIGVPLIKCCTLIHVAEDVRDAEGPAKNFFRERRFRVRLGRDEHDWIVRERRPLFARSYCDGQLHRDLLREGILKEGLAGTIRFDYANAHSIFEYLMHRNAGTTYPYFLTGLARLG